MEYENYLGSGAVYEGTKAVCNLAEQLVKRYSWIGRDRCGIAIANESCYELVFSGKYAYAGYINNCPLVIGNEQTGLITANSRIVSIYGSQGVITFKINGLQDKHLQIMWCMPFLAEKKMNITIDSIPASHRELYDELYINQRGKLRSEQCTSWNDSFSDDLKLYAMIGESHSTPVAILLKQNKRKGKIEIQSH